MVTILKHDQFPEQHVENSLQNTAEVDHVLETFTALRLTPEFKRMYDYTPTAEDYRSNNLPVRRLSSR